MTHEEQLIHVARNQRQIVEALNVIEAAKIDGALVSGLRTQFDSLRRQLETHVPKEYPQSARIRLTPLSLTDHLESQEMIPSNLHESNAGRMYKLTKGQRQVLRDRYHLTPTKEVVLVDIQVWPAARDCVRSVTIKSTEHVPENRKHLLNACVIDDWAAFCEAVRIAEANAEIQAEIDKRKDQLATFLDRVKKTHNLTPRTAAGTILVKWLAGCDTVIETGDVQKDQQLYRDELRKALISFGEHQIAAFVKDLVTVKETKSSSASTATFASLLEKYSK